MNTYRIELPRFSEVCDDIEPDTEDDKVYTLPGKVRNLKCTPLNDLKTEYDKEYKEGYGSMPFGNINIHRGWAETADYDEIVEVIEGCITDAANDVAHSMAKIVKGIK